MVLRTEEPITLVKIMNRSFMNKDSENISYSTARLVDSEYNVFDLGIDKATAEKLANVVNETGHALFEVKSYQNKQKIKLVAFKKE